MMKNTRKNFNKNIEYDYNQPGVIEFHYRMPENLIGGNLKTASKIT